MTRFGRWVRNKLEGTLKKFYEGPEPPARLENMVSAFAEIHPYATRGDWARFASEHAAEAYRSGYTRGFEYTERDKEAWFPDVSPDAIADSIDPDWRWGEAFKVNDPDLIVPEEFADDVILRAELDAAARRHELKR